MNRNAFITRSLIASVIVSATFVFLPGSAYACLCVAGTTQEEAYENATAVFVGRVLSIEEHRGVAGQLLRTLPFFDHRPSYRTISFHVTERWKGADANLATVASGFGGGDCGFYFAEGETYLVWAHDGDFYGENLATGICTRTEVLRHAGGDIAALGPGDSTFTEEESLYDPTDNSVWSEVLGDTVGLVTEPITRTIFITPWYVALGIIALYLTPVISFVYWLYRRLKQRP
jgi:hypothetical protein